MGLENYTRKKYSDFNIVHLIKYIWYINTKGFNTYQKVIIFSLTVFFLFSFSLFIYFSILRLF